MGREAKFALKILLVLVGSFAIATTLILPAVKRDIATETQMVALSDEIHIDISSRGYFVRGGSFIAKSLQLQRGRHVKIIFHYDYPGSDTEAPSHQFIIFAPKTEERDEFRLTSDVLSSENRQVEMDLLVGEKNIDRYVLGCSISCDAMNKLFREIEVVR